MDSEGGGTDVVDDAAPGNDGAALARELAGLLEPLQSLRHPGRFFHHVRRQSMKAGQLETCMRPQSVDDVKVQDRRTIVELLRRAAARLSADTRRLQGQQNGLGHPMMELDAEAAHFGRQMKARDVGVDGLELAVSPPGHAAS